jgi:hypothetical protein
MKRSATMLLGTALASIVAFGSPALADKPADKRTPAMKVNIDKDTGQLRKANEAEAADMESATQRQLTEDWWNRTVPDTTGGQEIQLANGTKAVRMSADSLEAFAIRIDENGKAVALHTAIDNETVDGEAVAGESQDEE